MYPLALLVRGAVTRQEGEPPPVLFARTLAALNRSGIEARLAEHFDAAAVAELAAAGDARIVVLDVASLDRATQVVTALRAAGAVARAAHRTIATVATPAQLAAARNHAAAMRDELDALARGLANSIEPPALFRLRDRTLDLRSGAHVMGIVNITPDSFYERVSGVRHAVARAAAVADEGAALLDIGGQSYAAGTPRISADEERGRIVPVVRAIVTAGTSLALSVDTFDASVAGAALAAGAHLINDCSGLSDPDLAPVVAHYDAALVVMHIKGRLNVRTPRSYVYGDALAEIVEFLYERTERARAAGVRADAIAIDPGLEFGKEPATDLEILERFGELTALGYPVVLAGSRKSFLGRLYGLPAGDLLVPSLATAGVGIAAGARIVRVHDVAQTVQLARLYAALSPDGRRSLGVIGRPPNDAASGNFGTAATV